jgi:hypothetical protein
VIKLEKQDPIKVREAEREREREKREIEARSVLVFVVGVLQRVPVRDVFRRDKERETDRQLRS